VADDKDLQRDVLEELLWEPGVDATEIRVVARDGVVTLTGTAATRGEKLTAARVAGRVHGVKRVADGIEVRRRASCESTDAYIARAARDALKWRFYA
jgi:osmotically-inducible protein OsmY